MEIRLFLAGVCVCVCVCVCVDEEGNLDIKTKQGHAEQNEKIMQHNTTTTCQCASSE